MKNAIVSNLAPINDNDLTFFKEVEKALNSRGFKVHFWSCIYKREFKNYIQMSWDIAQWERFGEKLSNSQKEDAHKLVDKAKWLPRMQKLVKQTNSDIEFLYDVVVYNSYYILLNMNIDVFFSWNNLCPHSGILNDMCNSKGIETFLIERGNFPNTWYLEKGGLLGHSVIANKTFDELGLTQSHFDIGKDFIQNLQFGDNEKYAQNKSEETFVQLQVLKDLAKQADKPIVVMFPPDDGTIGFFPCEHEDRKKTLPNYKNSFDAAKMIAKQSNAIVIFKPHPSFIGWSYDLEDIENIFVIDYDYKYLIEYSDIVASSGSGLGLIALANKKPLISLSVDIIYGKGIAYEAIRPEDIETCVISAYNMRYFNEKLDNLYYFVGYMMKEYMITLSGKELFSAHEFISNNIHDKRNFLKRLLNAVF
ncbi:hypothetical protein ACGRH2_03995 [Vibrio barjaei]|uniref:Capsular biosynthesis protein n=1 Tax=Vibrio barjaei TaxID=1676683 RepID=A0ABW7IDC8_9VIBR